MNKFLLTEALGSRELVSLRDLNKVQENGDDKCCFLFKDALGTTWAIHADRTFNDAVNFLKSPTDNMFDCKNKPDVSIKNIQVPFF